MAQDHFYEPLSLFQLRAPLMPLSAYEELSDSLTRLAQNPIVREAILVSSRSLFNSLDYIADDTQERKRQQVMRGVWRYANRMITRPTPFGLFAGVTIGTFGEKTALRLQAPETFGKRTRPDMEWLSKVVQKLEHTPAILRQLHVQTNPLVQRVGNRVQVAFAQDVDSKTLGAGNAPSIRSTWVVEAILEAAQSWMSFDQLVALILEQEPSAPEEKITQLLTVLCRHEFLITSLRLPLTNSQPFDHLRTVLASVNGIVPLQERLERIADLIRLYDQQPPGDGIEAYDAIVREMKQLEEVKDMLQVDLRLEAGEAVLPHDLGQEVAKAAECVWRLSTRSTGFEHLESYRTAFRERYGTEREVPLLELLDEYKGLGAPATYEMPRSRMQVSPLPSSVKAQRDSLLLQLVSECIRDGRQELVLDEEQVRKLTVRQRTTDQAPLSQEVFVRLSAVSAEAVDRGDYLLHMGRMSSMTAGKSFGRFADLLGDAHHRLADEIQCREQLLQPEAEFAEILHRPAIGRFMNIALTSHARTHEISLGAPSLKAPEQVIQPDDLLVGCTDNAFYLRSKRSGRIVIPTATHMLTTKGSPNVYRFLRELAFEGKGLLESFSWGSLERAPFLPRLRYGKAILSPACWTLHRDMLTTQSKECDWEDALQAYRIQWKLPRHVLLADRDLHLILDLDQPMHIEELRRELAALEDDESLVLYETDLFESGSCLIGSQGEAFAAEFVFPLVLRQEHQSVPKAIPRKQSPVEVVRNTRTHLPGGEWMYWKLYVNKSREEEFIGFEVTELCRVAQEQGWAEMAFFIRYLDPEPHIRLRLHGSPERLWSAMPTIYNVLRRWEEEGLLSKALLDTYEPELERYGGAERMHAAEQVFAADSEMVMTWVGHMRAGRISMEADTLAMISLLDILSHFGLTTEQQLAWLESRVERSLNQQEFRVRRKELMRYADVASDRAGLRAHPNGAQLIEEMNKRGVAIRAYAERLAEFEVAGHTNITRDSIIASVIHMHINRLLGIDRERERKVMAFARHALYQLRLQQAARDVETV